MTLSGVEGEAIGEDGEDEGVEDVAPVSIVKTTNRVAKDAKAANGRSSTVGHDCNVVFPLEFVMDKNT